MRLEPIPLVFAVVAAGPACGDNLAPQAPGVTIGGRLVVPEDVPVGRGFPVVFLADDPDASGLVTLEGAGPARAIAVHRGRGVVTAVIERAGEATLVAVGVELGAPGRALVASERPVLALAGARTDERWDGSRDVLVTADTTIASLVVAAGTRVRLAAGVDLTITGQLRTEGSATAPVLFVPDHPDAPWAGLHLPPGATATLAQTWFIGGGGDPSQAFGHSASQPVVRVDGARLALEGGGIIDSPGKALGTSDAEVVLDDVVLARCDTGGELSRTTLSMAAAHVLEIPDGDGDARDDDNDGLYLQGIREVDGEAVGSTIVDTVFAVGEDDAIDHNGAEVSIARTSIVGFRHEGVATSTGGRVELVDVVIRDCQQGIEVGYGSPEVTVAHALVTGNQVGLRFGDDYDRPCTGHLDVSASIVVDNGDDVRNLVIALDGPAPDAITLTCSYVGDGDVEPGGDNLAAPPPLAGDCLDASAPPPIAACGPDPAGPLSCPDGSD